nr:F103 [uncultured bacterium]
MTPEAFIAKWRDVQTKERAAAQEHFIDLCRLLDEPTPNQADPKGDWYAFEKGATRTGAGRGWADVWKRGHFGWEYKGKHANLDAALRQLQLYALALESPPLLVVSDLDSIRIHTAFTNAVQETHVVMLNDLAEPDVRRLLKWVFTDPERLRPGRTRAEITERAAAHFGELATGLRARGHEPHAVAHFLNKLLFCLFVEDAGLLPPTLFQRLLENGHKNPQHLAALLGQLFAAMRQGGPFGVEVIDWFNGGLFDGDDVLPLDRAEVATLVDLSRLDWSQVEPAIFGTLFERGLDPGKRAQLGAHYTDPGSILRLVEPVIVQPLMAQWAQVRAQIAEQMDKAARAADKRAAGKTRAAAQQTLRAFLERLRTYRVLDPACGSGNFLYLALRALKDIEHRAILEAEALGLAREFPAVGPQAVQGLEINAYAAELARVTVWIGEIQWMLRHGYSLSRSPVLKPLDTIQQRDALLNADGSEAAWPTADAIVGNPPFLGDKKMLRELGEDYVTRLRSRYAGRVPGGADLVTYWFEKARAQVAAGQARTAGLVATNSIRGGANRKVLERILAQGPIFNAWSDEPWVNEGAAVRVSLVCFGAPDSDAPGQDGAGDGAVLDGRTVDRIHADLTAAETGASASMDLTVARRLPENAGVGFVGGMKKGRFDLAGSAARELLARSGNPHGLPNSDVVKPWANGLDITRRPSDTWIIDFGTRTQDEAALYEAPFKHVLDAVKPARDLVRNDLERARWWLHGRSAPDLRQAIAGLPRFIVTPRVAKHRLFAWLQPPVIVDGQLVVIARDDDITFGILHSRLHELWALRVGTSLEDRPRYTPTTCFETFPFPDGLTPNLAPDDYANPLAPAIAEAARQLVRLRGAWLNPPEWTQRVPEVLPGYPERILPRPGFEAHLKKRTLTQLYNTRPAWLANAHHALDQAVAAAYGWPADLSDPDLLARLLALNLTRTGP